MAFDTYYNIIDAAGSLDKEKAKASLHRFIKEMPAATSAERAIDRALHIQFESDLKEVINQDKTNELPGHNRLVCCTGMYAFKVLGK